MNRIVTWIGCVPAIALCVSAAAAEIDGVATESEGEDPRRRVVLRPA